jgi:predicted ATP-dependent Lon-type protease
MDKLDEKLNQTFDGKVVRKDLLHRIKKGTNVPTFVLSFCWPGIAPVMTQQKSRRALMRS